MLRRPHPGLIRRALAARDQARSLYGRVVSTAARLRFGALMVTPPALEERLQDAARVTPFGESLLGEIIAANIEAHGLEVVDAAADGALTRLAGSEPMARARLARSLAAFHERRGGILRPLELLEPLEARTSGSGVPAGRMLRLRRLGELLRSGVAFGDPLDRPWEPVPGRVLYYANQTLPHHSSGYAIRTHWLARTLRDLGWDLSVHTRLGYPNDRYDHLGVGLVAPTAVIDGVDYRFAPQHRFGRSIDDYQRQSVQALCERCAEVRPALLHAASDYTGGLAVAEVSKRLSIPSVYEVRGLWHMTRAAAQPAYLDSDHYRLLEGLEVQAAKNADHVFAITEAVAQVLRRGGVEPHRISVLPNAVDPTRFDRRAPDPQLAQRWRLHGKPTIGYLGVFKRYEGLDVLLQAASLLRRRWGDGFRLLLVGDGEAEADLRKLTKRLDLEELVRFTGRVHHEAVPDYYALCDLVAFPRKPVRVCEVVSPIKPFEAMAAQVPVVVSDVAALAEIVQHEETGLVHRADDAQSLADQLERLLGDPSLRSALAQRGRDWVVEHRTWSKVGEKVHRVYQSLRGPHAASYTSG